MKGDFHVRFDGSGTGKIPPATLLARDCCPKRYGKVRAMTLSGMSQEDERKRTTVEAFEMGMDDVETEGCGTLGTTWRRDPISAPWASGVKVA